MDPPAPIRSKPCRLSRGAPQREQRPAVRVYLAMRKLNEFYRALSIRCVVSKAEIASPLFAFDDDAGENAIELYIGRLRRKLGDALVIRTLRGIGYLVQAPGANDGA